jgi:hypothetical protein
LPAFVLLGVWLCYHRQADFWILVGITGLVARFWFYHAVYDDVLIILPMIALFRIAKHSAASEERGLLAGILLAVNIVTMLFLARWQYLPSPWHLIFTGGHALVWLADLIFLLDSARQTQSV